MVSFVREGKSLTAHHSDAMYLVGDVDIFRNNHMDGIEVVR
jgi:hypothetical protein